MSRRFVSYGAPALFWCRAAVHGLRKSSARILEEKYTDFEREFRRQYSVISRKLETVCITDFDWLGLVGARRRDGGTRNLRERADEPPDQVGGSRERDVDCDLP